MRMVQDKIERIHQLCYDLLHEYQSKSKYKEVGHSSRILISSVYTTENIDMEEQDPLSNYDLFVNRSSSNLIVMLELDYYLEENVLLRTQNFDILAWWKSNVLKYSTLQTIAKDVLTIYISTVASESAFSTRGRLISPHGSRLHANTLEALMCSQNWLVHEIQDAPVGEDSCTYNTINSDDSNIDYEESGVVD